MKSIRIPVPAPDADIYTMEQTHILPTLNTDVDEKLSSLNQQQPKETPSMEVVKGGNRNAKNKPLDVYGSRGWSHGLFSCGDCKMCVLGCCCPCVAFAKVKRRREFLEEKGEVDPEHGGSFVSEDCKTYWLLNLCGGGGWAMQIENRAATRQRYNIRGTHVRDHMASYCCNPCAMSQESAELALEEQSLEGRK